MSSLTQSGTATSGAKEDGKAPARQKNLSRIGLAVAVIAVLGLIAAPFFVYPVFIMTVLCFALFATVRAFALDRGSADVRRDALEEEGTVVGTPDLMAPEQARGETARVDARTDVYAIGATLYTLLTHHRPFARSSLLTTLTAVLRDAPRRPREFDPEIPEALEEIALRCLQSSRLLRGEAHHAGQGSRLGGAGGHRIHPDPLRGEFERPAAGQMLQCGLAGRVV